ncbi:transferase [Xylaria bambusicola]|uniref:transferase n=1 Tax=Xylaria bambusicola TaxID=326684 RepID=UPI0020074999|nr:transferase [Xylaria bambusicola]KAI0521225.1 transferase [Xylaria bambusicola]
MVTTNDTPPVRVAKRVFPTDRSNNITTTPLSIPDATVVRFTDCGAIWFYDKTDGVNANDPDTFERLESALSETLSEYPHFTGQLRWATKKDVEDSCNPRHFGRPVVIYRSEHDPGMELIRAKDGRELSAIVPSMLERSTSKKIWDISSIRQSDFLPDTRLAFSNITEYENLPVAAAQLTAFKCGGFAVGIRITHCLSDAICLLHFIHTWAERSRCLYHTQTMAETSPALSAVFNPGLLDAHANLDPRATEPDTERLSRALGLPMHRFDWWATDAPGYPSWATATTKATMPAAAELTQVQLSPSTVPPWATWDSSAAVDSMQIRFSRAEVERMKLAAMESLPNGFKGQAVSRQDALLAHLWILVNRARQLENLPEQVYLDISLGMRNRVSPPLPDTFVGSPILLAYTNKTGAETAASTIGAAAAAIRQTVSQFTSQAISDHLYASAHEISPQRLWQAFLGSRHILVTSWARSRAYEVNFHGTGVARYVQAQMPFSDGVMQLMDIAATGDFDVNISLEKGAMEQLLSHPMLRAYDEA